METNSIMEKIKELVRKGNVSRIIVRRADKEIINIPVNVGVGVGVVALATAKWLLLAGALATIGFGCTVEVIKDDGQVVDVLTEEKAQKAKDAAADVVEQVKKTFTGEAAEESKFDETVSADEPKDDEEPKDL